MTFPQATLDEPGHAELYCAWEFVFGKDLFTKAPKNPAVDVVEKAILIAAPGNRLGQSRLWGKGKGTQQKDETTAR